MGSCLGRNSSNKLNSTTSRKSLVSSCLGRQSTDDQDLDLVSNFSDSYNRKHNIIFRIWNFKRKKKSSHYLDKFWQHQDTNYAKLNNGNQAESYSDIQLQNLDVNNLLLTSGHTKETAVNYLPSRVPSSRASSSLDLEWEHEYSQIRHFNQQLLKQKAQLQTQQNYSQLSMASMPNTNKDEISADESWQYMQQDEDQSMASLSSLGPANDSLYTTTKNKERSNEKRSLLRTNSRMLRTGSITRNSSHNSWSHISTPESLEWDIDEDQQKQLKMEDDNLDHETLKLLHQIEQLKNRVLYETGEGLFTDILDNGEFDYVGNNTTTTNRGTSTINRFQLGDSDGENANYS
ncbi:uncharacterized protein ACRADG_005210 isoform 1-T4 [Cochliomyia hominivorax]